MFSDIKIDTTQFNMTVDEYLQSQSLGADTYNKTRCDVWVEPRSTYVLHESLYLEYQLTDSAGVVIPLADEEVIAGTAIDKLLLMHNGPFCLESFYILNGNSTGEILYEINNNAGIYMDM